jgi:hypothetical protein
MIPLRNLIVLVVIGVAAWVAVVAAALAVVH